MEISGQEINTYKPFYNYINIDLYLYVKSSHYVLFKTRVGDIKREAHNLKYDYKRMLIRANNYIRILTINIRILCFISLCSSPLHRGVAD